jgi:hypothetical protein
MNGFGVLVRKELLESWRTRRLPVVAVLFVLVGVISPLTARYLPEILELSLGDQLPIPSPVPTALDALSPLQKNLGQIGALAAIAPCPAHPRAGSGTRVRSRPAASSQSTIVWLCSRRNCAT